MKRIFIVYLLLSTWCSYATSSICENVFLLNQNRNMLRKYTFDSYNSVKRFNKNLKESDNLQEQFYYLKDQYTYNMTYVLRTINKIERKLAKRKLSPSYYIQEFDKSVEGLMRKQIPFNEAYIDFVTHVFDKEKLRYKVMTKYLDNKNQLYPYRALEIITSRDSKRKSIRALKIHQDEFQITSYDIDLIQNLRNGSLGFRDLSTNRIDLGPHAFKDLLVDDALSLVTKHELKHANFSKIRRQEIPSVFHAAYISRSGVPLSSIENAGYRTFMSAEELYNAANNAFWGSRKLINAANYEWNEIRFALNTIHEWSFKSRHLAEHGREIAQDFVKLLKQKRDIDIPRHRNIMMFFDESFSGTNVLSEASFVGIVDMKRDIVGMMFIDRNLKELAKKYFKVNEKTSIRLNKHLQEFGSPKNQDEMNSILEKYMGMESRETEQIQLELVNYFIKQQDDLVKYTDKIIEKAAILEEHQRLLFSRMKAEKKSNPNFYKEEYWVDEIRKVREQTRYFSNLVKENMTKP